MTIKEFRLPDLGEGLTESELVSWLVREGDTVVLNQVIAEVETAKALVELPSPHAGIIARLYVDAGVTVKVGDPIVAFEIAGGADDPAQAAGPAAGKSAGVLAEEIPPNLVGYGALAEPSGVPARRARNISGGMLADAVAGPPLLPANLAVASDPTSVRSTPPVRQLAQQLGIDIDTVVGTGEGGLVTRSDVESATATASATAVATEGSDPQILAVTGVHRLMANAMVSSAFTAPHVTVFLTVDVTKTVDLLERLRSTREFRELRLTFLAAVSRAVCLAIRTHPEINSRWQNESGSIIRYRHVGLGIAAATPRGLIVPAIPHADELDLAGLASTLAELVSTAKAGRTSPKDLTGGTFTISNIGVFGVDAGTPILNNGEAAILAVGAVARRPFEHEDQVALRQVVTLSLSFDHRVLDGAQGSKFLSDVGRLLNDPASAFALA